MVHRVGRKTRRRIGMAIAALAPRHWNVRRRDEARRSRAIMATRAVGVGRRVSERSALPARKRRRSGRVAGDAIAAAGRYMAREGCRTLRAFASLRRERPVVAGVASAGADRSVVHRIGCEARRRIDVAIAALDARHRDVRRRRHAHRATPVVAT